MAKTDTEKLIEEVIKINGEIEELQNRNNDIVGSYTKLFQLILYQQKIIDLLYEEVFKQTPPIINYDDIFENFPTN